MPRGRLALAISLSALMLPCAAPSQAPQPFQGSTPGSFQAQNSSVTTIQTKARIVVLDVVVVDAHGLPVKGLKPIDFALSEDGVPQTLASITERDATSSEPPAPPPLVLPPNTFVNHAPLVNNTAMTVLLFDTSDLSFADAAYARDEVARYVKKIKPGMPICIFDLDPWGGLRLIQDFTTDPRVLAQAVQGKNNAQKPVQPRFTPNLQRTVAMRQLARYLAGFPGRKNLIWFSGSDPNVRVGRPGGLFPDTTAFSSQAFAKDLQGAAETLTLNRVALYTVDPRGVVFDQDENSLASWPAKGSSPVVLRASAETAFQSSSSDVVLQQGADASAAAEATGGKAFYNSNAIDKEVAEVVATGTHYYTVSYTPTNKVWDGSFRNITMQLSKNGATSAGVYTSGIHLEYRNGYYAEPDAPRALGNPFLSLSRRTAISYSPAGNPNGTPLSEAMSFGAVPPFQVLFKAHITPAPTTAKLKGNAQLPEGNFLAAQWRRESYREYQIHYSVNPADIQFAAGADGLRSASVQFVAVLYNAYRAIVNSFVNTVPLDVNAADLSRIMESGIGIELPIAIPAKGDFYLRLGVHDLNSGRVGALEVPVSEIKLAPVNMAGNASTAP